MQHLFKKIIYFSPAIISGILLAVSFPKANIYPAAWIALVPLLVFLHNKTPKHSFIAGFITGLLYFFLTTYWIYHSINHYGPIPLIPSLLLVLLLSAYLALYPAIFSFLYTYQMRKTALPSMLVAPLFWTSLEYARSSILSGFPWSSLGYSQYKFLTFIQFAEFAGVYGVTFFIVAFNGAIADALLIKKRRAQRPLMPLYPSVITLCSFLFLFISILIYGALSMSKQRADTTVRVAIIQGNIEQDKKWVPQFQRYVMDTYKSLTLEAKVYKPDLIVWPETALPFYYDKERGLTEELVSFQSKTDSYLLTGSMMIKESPRSTKSVYTNSAILFDREAKITYIYDKIQLVPFGEYVPLRNILFFINKLTYGIVDYTPGEGYIKAITPFGPFATVICYEIIFPGLVRKFFKKDGGFLINITNDAWFGTTSGPYQHFSMAVFRAIENRKPIVRAANTGISGFIDSSGRIEKTLGLFHRGILVSDIKTNGDTTFYARYGDIFIYFAVVFSIILSLKRER